MVWKNHKKWNYGYSDTSCNLSPWNNPRKIIKWTVRLGSKNTIRDYPDDWILRRVLKTWGDLLSFQWKTISYHWYEKFLTNEIAAKNNAMKTNYIQAEINYKQEDVERDMKRLIT